MQTANNVSEVVGVDVEDPADDYADGDVSFTTPTMEGPSRAISNDDNENPGNINTITTKWRLISLVSFLVATVIIVAALSAGITFDGGDRSKSELTTVANKASTRAHNNFAPGKSLSTGRCWIIHIHLFSHAFRLPLLPPSLVIYKNISVPASPTVNVDTSLSQPKATLGNNPPIKFINNDNDGYDRSRTESTTFVTKHSTKSGKNELGKY
jgi:hypothetical protein